MTTDEAEKTLYKLFENPEISEEDESLYVECLSFLAEYTDNEALSAECYYYLAEYYYEYERYELAEGYYKISSDKKFDASWGGLGDIYLNGKLGSVDYKKAFECYSEGVKLDNYYCRYRIAEMYCNGQYVCKDVKKYKELIEKLYFDAKDNEKHWWIYPDIAYRYIDIIYREGIKDKAVELYGSLIYDYIDRIVSRRFTGSVEYLLNIIGRYYENVPFDEDNINIFTLSYLMKNPVRIVFMYKDKSYKIETLNENGNIIVRFENKWYRNIKEFYINAKINDCLITSLVYDIYGIEIIKN